MVLYYYYPHEPIYCDKIISVACETDLYLMQTLDIENDKRTGMVTHKKCQIESLKNGKRTLQIFDI